VWRKQSRRRGCALARKTFATHIGARLRMMLISQKFSALQHDFVFTKNFEHAI
jgi:hypothetical protein